MDTIRNVYRDGPEAQAQRDAANAEIRANGFNYGTGNTAPTPMIYYAVEAIKRQWDKVLLKASHNSWAMEMALRDWRRAETPREMDLALASLEVYAAGVGPDEPNVTEFDRLASIDLPNVDPTPENITDKKLHSAFGIAKPSEIIEGKPITAMG